MRFALHSDGSCVSNEHYNDQRVTRGRSSKSARPASPATAAVDTSSHALTLSWSRAAVEIEIKNGRLMRAVSAANFRH